MATTSIAGMTEKEVKEALNRIAIVKLLIQRICTPVSAMKRLSSIRTFFQKNSSTKFTEKENLMIWKGLFYALWYSEMGKGCEETIEAIVTKCQRSESLLLAGMQTLVNEWKGIDSIRLDKFAYFTRRLTNAMFLIEVRDGRGGELVQSVISVIQDTAGLLYQFCTVFMEEMIRVLEQHPDHFTVVTVLSLLKPVIHLLSVSRDPILQNTIQKEILIDSFVQLTDSSFCEQVIKYQKWLIKMLETFVSTSPNRKQQKVLCATITRLNDEDELRVVFEAAENAANPRKRTIKRFRRKDKRRKCNL
jgi:hypothetical protein